MYNSPDLIDKQAKLQKNVHYRNLDMHKQFELVRNIARGANLQFTDIDAWLLDSNPKLILTPYGYYTITTAEIKILIGAVTDLAGNNAFTTDAKFQINPELEGVESERFHPEKI